MLNEIVRIIFFLASSPANEVINVRKRKEKKDKKSWQVKSIKWKNEDKTKKKKQKGKKDWEKSRWPTRNDNKVGSRDEKTQNDCQ